MNKKITNLNSLRFKKALLGQSGTFTEIQAKRKNVSFNQDSKNRKVDVKISSVLNGMNFKIEQNIFKIVLISCWLVVKRMFDLPHYILSSLSGKTRNLKIK
tara:strand:+ start:836 stop:1138 length:303 start_codon:yes stop_codon:yes gene_type:complete